MRKNNYKIIYLSNGEQIEEFYSTIEVIIVLIIANLKKDFYVKSIERLEFYD